MTSENETTTTLTLRWSKPDSGGNAKEINGYQIKWKFENGSSGGEKNVTAEYAIINRLTSNTNYNITVAVRGEKQNSDGDSTDNLEATTCK